MCRVISLPSAQAEIVRTFWLQTRGDRSLSPYCFVLGAGISVPLVPTASKLVVQFREEITRARLAQPPDTLSHADGYYACFDQAFPNPQLRRDFLRRLIQGKPPSTANFQAARLLGPQGLASLAITTNFDRMLPRALELQRFDLVALDHPETIVRRLDPKGRGIQVLQIHGTYEHYDFCNVREEILDRAKALTPLLYALFLQWCPIVVGYSGWEDDAIMSALKLRLTQARGSMTAGLYWMCYTQADADGLPGWLKDDPSVRIVVASDDAVQPSNLPAVEVFGALLEGLEETRAMAAPSARPVAVPVPVSFMALAAAEQALAQGEHERAVEELRPLDLAGLTAGERAHCGTVLRQVYEGACRTKPETALAACQLWQAVAELSGSMTMAEQRRMRAHAIYGQGRSLLVLGRCADAMERLREVRKLSLSAPEDRLVAERAAHAGNALAVALHREGRTEEAFAGWRELVLGPGAEGEGEEAVPYALFNLGRASDLAGRPEHARIYWNALRDRVAAGEDRHLAQWELVRLLEELRKLESPADTDALVRAAASAMAASNRLVKLLASLPEGRINSYNLFSEWPQAAPGATLAFLELLNANKRETLASLRDDGAPFDGRGAYLVQINASGGIDKIELRSDGNGLLDTAARAYDGAPGIEALHAALADLRAAGSFNAYDGDINIQAQGAADRDQLVLSFELVKGALDERRVQIHSIEAFAHEALASLRAAVAAYDHAVADLVQAIYTSGKIVNEVSVNKMDKDAGAASGKRLANFLALLRGMDRVSGYGGDINVVTPPGAANRDQLVLSFEIAKDALAERRRRVAAEAFVHDKLAFWHAVASALSSISAVYADRTEAEHRSDGAERSQTSCGTEIIEKMVVNIEQHAADRLRRWDLLRAACALPKTGNHLDSDPSRAPQAERRLLPFPRTVRTTASQESRRPEPARLPDGRVEFFHKRRRDRFKAPAVPGVPPKNVQEVKAA
jgi:hypothetical protein